MDPEAVVATCVAAVEVLGDQTTSRASKCSKPLHKATKNTGHSTASFANTISKTATVTHADLTNSQSADGTISNVWWFYLRNLTDVTSVLPELPPYSTCDRDVCSLLCVSMDIIACHCLVWGLWLAVCRMIDSCWLHPPFYMPNKTPQCWLSFHIIEKKVTSMKTNISHPVSLCVIYLNT